MKSSLNLPDGFTLGLDFAGVIKHIGDKVTKFKIGDQVYGTTALDDNGSFAELITINQKYIVHIPTAYGEALAATVPFAAVSAYKVIMEVLVLDIKPGTRILINDAGREEGYFAVQFAKMRGAYVLGCVAKESNAETVCKLGADEVGEFGLPSNTPKDIDVFVDFAYKAGAAEAILPNVKKTGIVVYVDDMHHKGLVEKYGLKGVKFGLSEVGDELSKITNMINERQLEARVGEKFLFADYANALERESEKAGKDILLVDKLYVYEKKASDAEK